MGLSGRQERSLGSPVTEFARASGISEFELFEGARIKKEGWDFPKYVAGGFYPFCKWAGCKQWFCNFRVCESRLAAC